MTSADLVDDTHGVLFLRVSSQREGMEGEIVVAQFCVTDDKGRLPAAGSCPTTWPPSTG